MHIGPENITELENELKSVVEWFHLGLEIGIPLWKLKNIENAVWRFPEKCLLEMLQCYMEMVVDKKWHAIVQALASIGQGTLAIKIALKYGNTSNCMHTLCNQLHTQYSPPLFGTLQHILCRRTSS